MKQADHSRITAKFRYEFYFAEFFGREYYSFFKKDYIVLIPEGLQFYPSVCRFHAKYVAFFSSISDNVGHWNPRCNRTPFTCF